MNTYNIGPTKKLIDINKDLVNFEARFRVKGEGEFYALVANQSTLDNTPDLVLKKVTSGVIEGSFKDDKGAYQNYFLILRADDEMPVEVSIDVREIPKRVEVARQPNIIKKGWNWKLILGIVLAVVIVIGLYYYFSQKPAHVVTFGTGLISNASSCPVLKGIDTHCEVSQDAPILPPEIQFPEVKSKFSKGETSFCDSKKIEPNLKSIPKPGSIVNRFKKFNLGDE